MDKINIECLGWKYDEDNKRYELNRSNILTYRYYYLYHRPGCLIYKSIITIYLNGTSQNDVIIYRMEIKNKEELDFICKRLSIYE